MTKKSDKSILLTTSKKLLSIDELVASVSSNDEHSPDRDQGNLTKILIGVAVEYLEHVWHLDTLDSAQMARVDQLEKFYSELANVLSDKEYSSVEMHIRAFANIKYQYRNNFEQTVPTTLH